MATLFGIHNVFSTLASAVVGSLTLFACRQLQTRSMMPASVTQAGTSIDPALVTSGVIGCVVFFSYRARLFKKFPVSDFLTRAIDPRLRVGIADIFGDRKAGRPTVAVFYTTTQAEVDKAPSRFVPWAYNDPRCLDAFSGFVAATRGISDAVPSAKLSFFKGFLRMAVGHTTYLKLEAATGAKPAVEASKLRGSLSRIVVLQHGMIGNSHCHSDLAKSILNEFGEGGAVVICPWATDNSTHAYYENEQDVVEYVGAEALDVNAHPSAALRQMREAQLAKRLESQKAVFDFIADESERGLFARLLGSTGAAKDFLASQRSNGKVEILYIGHSFGASTAVAVAANGPFKNVRVQRVVALDTWNLPLATMISALEEAKKSGSDTKTAVSSTALREVLTAADEQRGVRPPLVLGDSEEWQRWTLNKTELSRLANAWPADSKVWHDFVRGTDHLSGMDVGKVMINERKKYVKLDERYQNLAAFARMLVPPQQ